MEVSLRKRVESDEAALVGIDVVAVESDRLGMWSTGQEEAVCTAAAGPKGDRRST